MVLGLWVHMTMVFVAAAHVIIHVGSMITGVGATLRGRPSGTVSGQQGTHTGVPLRRMPFCAWLLCGTLTLQLYALALPEFLRTALHQVSLPSEWTSLQWVLTESLRSLQVGFATIAVVAGGAAVAAIGWLSILRRAPAAALAMVLPALLGGVCMWVLAHNLWPRFFFFSMGFALLIVVHGALRTAALLAGRWAGVVGTGLAGALILASAATVPRCYAHPKQDFAGARDYVEQQRTPGDVVVAVGLAGVVYKRYYAPQWLVAQTQGELDAIRQAHSGVWLVYTLPIQVKTYRPDIWATIDKNCQIVKVFPGTLGGGEVTVCRLRHTWADSL